MRTNRIPFLIVAIVPLTYISGNWTVPPLGDPLFIKSAAGEIYASALLLLYILSAKTSEKFQAQKNLTVYVAAVFFIYISLSAFWAQNPGFFVDAWLKWFAAAVTFGFGVLIARTPAFVPAVVDIMVISAVMVASIGLAQYYVDWNYLHQTAAPGSTFSNRNLAGHVIVICLPLAFFRLLLSSSSILQKFTSIAAILILGIYGYHTMATGVRVSIAAEAALLSCFLIWLYVRKYRTLSRDVSVVAAFSILVGFIFLIPLGESGTVSETFMLELNESFSALIKTEYGSGSRLDVWEAAWSIFREHPIIGIGLGNFYEVWSNGYIEYPNLLGLQRVHNDYLEIAADLGLIGFFLVILLYILIVISGLRLSTNSDQHISVISILIICSLVGFGVNSLVSFPLQVIAPLVSIALLSGLLVGSDLSSWKKSIVIRLNRTWIKFASVLAATAILLANIYLNFHWLRDINRLSAKLTLAEKSTRWQPSSNFINPNIINPLRIVTRIYLQYDFLNEANSLVSNLTDIWPDEPFNLILALETNLNLGQLTTAEKIALRLKDHQPRYSFSAEHYLLNIYSKRNELSNIRKIYSRLRELATKEHEANRRIIRKIHFLSILFEDQTMTETMFQLHEETWLPNYIVDANMAVFYANNNEPEKAYALATRSLTESDYFRGSYAFRKILAREPVKKKLQPFRRESLEQLKNEPALGLYD